MTFQGFPVNHDGFSRLELANANRAKALELGYKIQSLEEKYNKCQDFEKSKKILQEMSQLRNIQIELGHAYIERRKYTPPKPPGKLSRIFSKIGRLITMFYIGYAVFLVLLVLYILFIY